MANKIYVGNLSYNLTEEGLRAVFVECGQILEVKMVKDSFTGKPRGFGFITFSKPEALEKAVQMDGKSVNGRNLRVSVAQDRGRRSLYFHGRGVSA